jgi:hypothetical protein
MGIFDRSAQVLAVAREVMNFLDNLHQALLVVRGVLLSVDTAVEAVSAHLHAYLDSKPDA